MSGILINNWIQSLFIAKRVSTLNFFKVFEQSLGLLCNLRLLGSMCLLSFGSGTVSTLWWLWWCNCQREAAGMGGIIHPKQSTQSGGGLLGRHWGWTCVHLITGAELTVNGDLQEPTRDAAHHRVKKLNIFLEVKYRLLCSDTHSSVIILGCTLWAVHPLICLRIVNTEAY